MLPGCTHMYTYMTYCTYMTIHTYIPHMVHMTNVTTVYTGTKNQINLFSYFQTCIHSGKNNY
jgi:hypothetical protein